jgi:putative hydrolase of the HAD superfamily
VIDAVVYDFGGVFMASPFEAIRRLSADKGHEFEVALELLLGAYDVDTDHPWHRAERGELDIKACREEIRQLAREQGHDLDLFELFAYIGEDRGIHEPMVDSVRRARTAGARTAILTNNIAEARDMWKAMLPVDELFDVIVDSSEVGMRKPDPRIYTHVLELLGDLPPERSVFLDDYPGNVAAAESVGMIGILVEDDRDAAIARLDALLQA